MVHRRRYTIVANGAAGNILCRLSQTGDKVMGDPVPVKLAQSASNQLYPDSRLFRKPILTHASGSAPSRIWVTTSKVNINFVRSSLLIGTCCIFIRICYGPDSISLESADVHVSPTNAGDLAGQNFPVRGPDQD